jgi:hypothetical protein
MYLFGEQPPYARQLISRLRSIPAQLLDGVSPCSAAIQIDSSEDIASNLPNDQLFVIQHGSLFAVFEDQCLLYLQEGDLIGLRQNIGLPDCRYTNEHPLTLTPYARNDVFKHIHADEQLQDLFIQYIIGNTALLSDALARMKRPQSAPATGFCHYARGDILIRQGDEADHVFIIIEGHAEALVDGVKVGDVLKDEIFGAMAVFTQGQRSSSVVASEPCTVMVIPKDQFIKLVKSNPCIAHSLIESLARCISLLNKNLAQLHQQQTQQALAPPAAGKGL